MTRRKYNVALVDALFTLAQQELEGLLEGTAERIALEGSGDYYRELEDMESEFGEMHGKLDDMKQKLLKHIMVQM